MTKFWSFYLPVRCQNENTVRVFINVLNTIIPICSHLNIIYNENRDGFGMRDGPYYTVDVNFRDSVTRWDLHEPLQRASMAAGLTGVASSSSNECPILDEEEMLDE